MSRPIAIPDDLARRLDDPSGELPEPSELPSDLRWAAVIGLLLRESEDDPDPRLVLIERSRRLRAHAGQVAFPGGKPEPHDASLLDTALREATEEVDLPPGSATVLGRLRPVPTPTGFFVMPFVAWAPPAWEPRAACPEVHRVLTPRLRQLADPSIHRITGRGVWRGHPYEMHEYAVHDPPVWGATALMVRELLRRLGMAGEPWP